MINTSVSANSERPDLSVYIDRIIERASADSNGEVNIEKLLDQSVEKATNKIIADLVKADFSRYSKIRGSLKQVLLEANKKQLDQKSVKRSSKKSSDNTKLVGV